MDSGEHRYEWKTKSNHHSIFSSLRHASHTNKYKYTEEDAHQRNAQAQGLISGTNIGCAARHFFKPQIFRVRS